MSMIDRRSVLAGGAMLSAAALQGCMQMPAASPVEGIRLRTIRSNGINMRIAEMGKGQLVLMVHGWPESWYSWRHQMPALAAAGYHVVAPDMRGYGMSDKPTAVEDYDIHHLGTDLTGIVDAMGEKSAILVGHDWGAIVCWNSLLLHPDRFSALAAMSVPYNGRGERSPIDGMRAANGENFYYILYFQEPGVAEKELDADPHGLISRLYLSPDSPREAPLITDPKRSAGGFLGRRGAAKGLPSWLTQKDLDYYVGEFTRAGFRGGINYYRNFDRNWQTTPQLTGVKIQQPVTFIAGSEDTVIRGATAASLETSMKRNTTDFRGATLIPGAGHWVQQEKPEEVNALLLSFIAGLKR
jgi:pimeloyl-ACP methyl ester carboxylesterase